MFRLIEADFAATWQKYASDGTPSFFVNCGVPDAFFCKRSHFGFQVVAHEIEFVRAIFFGGMERGLTWRQCEDQPAVAGIDGFEAENVAEKGAVRFSVLAIDDYVSS